MAPEGQRGRTLRVHVSNESGRPVSPPGIARWLARVAPVRARGDVSIALVSDSRVRALNRRYRRRDYATDVLSFQSTPELTASAKSSAVRRSFSEGGSFTRRRKLGPTRPNPQSLAPSPYLGDIVIARGVARRQARAAGHSELTELRVLALHGLLHLLGYDHDGDDRAMARVERSLRAKGGLREGLIERSVRP